MVFNTVVFDTVVFNTVALYYPLNLIEPDFLFFLFISIYFYLFFFSFLSAFLANCIYLLIYSFFYDLICKMAVTYRILFFYLFSQFLWIQSMCCLQKILANLNRDDFDSAAIAAEKARVSSKIFTVVVRGGHTWKWLFSR